MSMINDYDVNDHYDNPIDCAIEDDNDADDDYHNDFAVRLTTNYFMII